MLELPVTLSLTDMIEAAVLNSLQMHRASLDGMVKCSQLTVIVNFDERRNIPRKVVIKPELLTYDKDNGHH